MPLSVEANEETSFHETLGFSMGSVVPGMDIVLLTLFHSKENWPSIFDATHVDCTSKIYSLSSFEYNPQPYPTQHGRYIRSD